MLRRQVADIAPPLLVILLKIFKNKTIYSKLRYSGSGEIAFAFKSFLVIGVNGAPSIKYFVFQMTFTELSAKRKCNHFDPNYPIIGIFNSGYMYSNDFKCLRRVPKHRWSDTAMVRDKGLTVYLNLSRSIQNSWMDA